jgi:hypothetical protein
MFLLRNTSKWTKTGDREAQMKTCSRWDRPIRNNMKWDRQHLFDELNPFLLKLI